MAILNHQLKANTLVETMVAMVIITTAFAVGMLIYINIVTGTGGTIKIKAHMLAKNTIANSLSNEAYIDQAWEIDNLKVQQALLDYNKSDQVKLLQVDVFSSDQKILATEKRIIHATQP